MGSRLVRRHFEFKQTAVTIVCEEAYLDAARRSIFRSRETIERFIVFDPLFQDTLEPYEVPDGADPLIERMCAAARAAGVGPMAAVAGSIAEEAVKAMVEAGAEQAVVDNGGDIALYLSEPMDIALFAGQSAIRDLGFRLPGERRPYGVCTSSGTVGPSISFGVADAAVVFAPEASLADACATRLGNEVKSGQEEIMRHALEVVCGIEGVDGALVVVEDRMALRGRVPELVKVKMGPDRISQKHF
jgi:ApbE superfamily uncharacterized protein (UPF0280 family)